MNYSVRLLALAAISISPFTVHLCAAEEPLTATADKEPSTGAKFLNKLRSSAGSGSARDQHILGSLYAHGDGGLPKDYREAWHWLGKAADQGYADAQFTLGVMAENGAGRIRIRHKDRKLLKDSLHRHGINESVLFPDVDALARHIDWCQTKSY